MAFDWYPTGIKSPGNDSGSFVAGYAFRGVLHTTEGSSATGAIGAYRAANSWPHFTVDPTGKVYQHVPLSKASRALQNASGGVETNRGGAIQIEVVGFASKPNWPEAQVVGLRLLMRWIETQTGIKPIGPGRFGGPEQYGLKNALELTNESWIRYNGWLGHQHVPENSHWDPGAINIQTLLPEVTPVPDPPPVHIAKARLVQFVPVQNLQTSEVIGYYMVTEDGEVFGFGNVAYFGRIDTQAIP